MTTTTITNEIRHIVQAADLDLELRVEGEGDKGPSWWVTPPATGS